MTATAARGVAPGTVPARPGNQSTSCTGSARSSEKDQAPSRS